MEITEVRIFPRESEDRKLKAYATITIDNAFVVRNVKVIEGNKGLFVAMPSRKLKESCPKCRHKNVVKSRFCNQCGTSLPGQERPVMIDREGDVRQSDHRDIAHPITPESRDYIQKKVLGSYDSYMKSGGQGGQARRPHDEKDGQACPLHDGQARSRDERGRDPRRPYDNRGREPRPRGGAQHGGFRPPETVAPRPEQPDFEGDLEL